MVEPAMLERSRTRLSSPALTGECRGMAPPWAVVKAACRFRRLRRRQPNRAVPTLGRRMTRTPPAATRRQLRGETGFVCAFPGCDQVYLEWHHFDPPGRNVNITTP